MFVSSAAPGDSLLAKVASCPSSVVKFKGEVLQTVYEEISNLCLPTATRTKRCIGSYTVVSGSGSN